MLSSEYFLKIAKINSQWEKPMCPSRKNYSFNETEKNPQSAKINSSKNSSLLFFSFPCFPAFSTVTPCFFCFPVFPLFLYAFLCFPGLFSYIFLCFPVFSHALCFPLFFPCSLFCVCFLLFSPVFPVFLCFPVFSSVSPVDPCLFVSSCFFCFSLFSCQRRQWLPWIFSVRGPVFPSIIKWQWQALSMWEISVGWNYLKERWLFQTQTHQTIIIDGSAIENASLLGKSKTVDEYVRENILPKVKFYSRKCKRSQRCKELLQENVSALI